MNFLRDIPKLLTKDEMVDILLREEYGYIPDAPESVEYIIEKVDEKFCAGKAILKKIRFHVVYRGISFDFPVYYTCLKKRGTHPCFIHINFRDCVPDMYQPTEEIVDRGYAVLSFNYKDVSTDDGDFSDGLAAAIYPRGGRKENQCGKIGLWAWAAMRVMDFAVSLPELDKNKISVIGHSRLGKTALLAGALDERFYCAFSNDSGCSGAAISRSKQGETVEIINARFPYWFCENYKKYSNNEYSMPFDQHYLIACNYPHRVYVASAEEDIWADPESEYLACVAASEFYEKQGMVGFISVCESPKAGTTSGDGHIGYHCRSGIHFLGREDWNRYMDYLDKCFTEDGI